MTFNHDVNVSMSRMKFLLPVLGKQGNYVSYLPVGKFLTGQPAPHPIRR